MSAAAFLTSVCTGHGLFPPRENVSASKDVFINSLGAHRVSDAWVPHCDPDTCHDSSLSTGSSSVFVNGLPIGRVGDTIACGSTIATGSSNVYVGE